MKLLSLTIKNYRTIEELEISFDHTYTAICGPNDSGKTNIIRAIRMFMQSQDVFFPNYSESISFKEDYTKWKGIEDDSEILFSFKLAVYRDMDTGLFQFIARQLGQELQNDKVEIDVNITYNQSTKMPNIEVDAFNKKYSGLEAQDIYNKIKDSKSALFHNSTEQVASRFRYPEYTSVRDLPGTAERFSELKNSVEKRLKNIAKVQQHEIEELLGRLDDKIKVGLSFVTYDLSYLPFNLTLGDNKVDVSLENWGSGTQNRARIMLTLFKARRTSLSEASANKITPIIVIEEPESFLHPYAQAEFGKVLQGLSDEFDVQVIVTTHSPYLLSMSSSSSNILLNRKKFRKLTRDTCIVDTSGSHWMEPFGQALGMDSKEFIPWQNLFGINNECILLVEGETDKEYFEMLQNDVHGDNKLNPNIDVIPYEGYGALSNTVLLKFIKNKHKHVFLTFDLDAKSKIEKNLSTLSLIEYKDFLPIGLPLSGKRNIEGLVPDHITSRVFSANPHLLSTAICESSDEQKSAKSKLKRLILDSFKKLAKPGNDFKHFYTISRTINKAFK